MKRSHSVRIGILMLASSLLLITGCSSPEKRLVGKWSVGKLSIRFDANHTVFTRIGDDQFEGTYTVDFAAEPITLDICNNNGNKKYCIILFLDDDTLQFAYDNTRRPAGFDGTNALILAREE